MLAHKAVVNYKHQSLDLWSAVCVDLPFLSFPHPSIFLLVTDSKWSALSLDSSGLGPLHSLFLSSTDSLSLTPFCVCLSVFMSVCLSVCMSECLFVCLFYVRMSACVFVCLSNIMQPTGRVTIEMHRFTGKITMCITCIAMQKH